MLLRKEERVERNSYDKRGGRGGGSCKSILGENGSCMMFCEKKKFRKGSLHALRKFFFL